MRVIILGLLLLLLLIQYPLWLGRGGWLKVWDLDKQVSAQKNKNDALQSRNAKLQGEVRDLKEGTGAIEERARAELGMVKEGEVFVQFVAPSKVVAPAAASTASVPKVTR